MNNPLSECDSKAELISLLAAGCLSHVVADELHGHLSSCTACRERYQQLRKLCGDLAELSEIKSDRAQIAFEGAIAAIREEAISNEPTGVLSTKTNSQFWTAMNRARRGVLGTAAIFLVGLGIGMLFQQYLTGDIRQPNHKSVALAKDAGQMPANHQLSNSDELIVIGDDASNLKWSRFDLRTTQYPPPTDSLVPINHTDGSQRFVAADQWYAALGMPR